MRRILTPSVLVFLVTFTACLLAACSLAADITPPPNYQPPTNLESQAEVSNGPVYPLVSPDIAAGAGIYAEKCALCHGPTGMGDGFRASEIPDVPALGKAEVARQSTPADWYSIVTEGNLERLMPPFTSLSDRERWDVVAYAYTLSMAEETISRGNELYQENCASCHGETGQGDGSQAASLGVPLPDFTDLAYQAGVSAQTFYDAISNGVSSSMPAYADKLPEDERWVLADYLRSLSFAPFTQNVTAEVTQSPQPTAEEAALVTPAITPTLEVTATQVTAEITPTLTLGIVNGKVINGSGGDVPQDLDINLHGLDGMSIVITDTTRADQDGIFTFQDVEMPAGRRFLATTEYQGAAYASEDAIADGSTDEINLEITLYETTTDTSVLSADGLHIFFDFSQPGVVTVGQWFIISNRGNKVVIPAEQGSPVVSFTLPEGAQNLRFQDGVLGERYVETPNGFGDTAAIMPGSSSEQLVYAYDLPVENNMEISQLLGIPVDTVVVFLPEGSYKVKSESLQDDGVSDVQGATFHMYSGGNLNAGDQLKMSLYTSIFPDLKIGSMAVPLVPVGIALGIFGLVLVVTGVLLYKNYRTREEEQTDTSSPPVKPIEKENPDSLMDAIIALDDLYKEGKLPEQAYVQRRAELKAQLKDTLEQK